MYPIVYPVSHPPVHHRAFLRRFLHRQRAIDMATYTLSDDANSYIDWDLPQIIISLRVSRCDKCTHFERPADTSDRLKYQRSGVPHLPGRMLQIWIGGSLRPGVIPVLRCPPVCNCSLQILPFILLPILSFFLQVIPNCTSFFLVVGGSGFRPPGLLTTNWS